MKAVPLVHRPFCRSVATRPAPVARRLIWLGLATAAAAAVTGAWPGLWIVLLTVVAPDIPLFIPGSWRERGRLSRRAVPVYNATHAVVGPLAVITLGLIVVAAGGGTATVGIGAAWLFHISVDRAVGYDLRTADGHVRQ